MLLAIDIGNTNLKIALWDGLMWRRFWRGRTVPTKLADEYAVSVGDWLRGAGLEWGAVSAVAISSVVPMLTFTFVELSQRYFQVEPLTITGSVSMTMRMAVDDPQQTGSDRIANAAAAAALYGGPAIAIDFGTATKFDVISGDGVYQGGAIAPGVRLSFNALVNRAALLHQVDVAPPPSPIGRSTIHALQSGIFWGSVSLVEHLTERIIAAMDEPNVKLITTGGLAPLLNPYLPGIHHTAPELTLDGIRIIYSAR